MKRNRGLYRYGLGRITMLMLKQDRFWIRMETELAEELAKHAKRR